MSPVTEILAALAEGKPQAAEQLFPLVYDELRRLAALHLAQEKPGQTLDATALVHEVYLRLVGADAGQQWESRRYFFATAVQAMRRILIENARRKQSPKHGGGRGRQDLDAADLPAPTPSDDLLALDEALDRLAAVDPVAAELVQLRYFAGFTSADAAGVLGISPRQADRVWAYARSWLYEALKSTDV
jgi:RNA polymerase sigma factor (TIGR02999 family)